MRVISPEISNIWIIRWRLKSDIWNYRWRSGNCLLRCISSLRLHCHSILRFPDNKTFHRLVLFSFQEVDLVLGALSITSERETVVDFSYPIWEEAVGMITLTVLDDQLYLFKPLHVHVWLSYATVMLLAAWLVMLYESWVVNAGMVQGRGPFSHTSTCLWYMYGAMWAQGKVHPWGQFVVVMTT